MALALSTKATAQLSPTWTSGFTSSSTFCLRAHKKNKWLDIGVPSLRNFRHLGRWRQFSWLLLAFSSVPIHLIYNSAVFQSLSSYDYTVAVVTDSFLHNASWSTAAADMNRAVDPGWNESRVNPPSINATQVIEQMQRNFSSHQNLSVAECFSRYEDYFAPQANVVILVKNQSVQTSDNGSLLLYVTVVPRSDDWAKNLWAVGNGTQRFVANEPTEPVTSWFLGPPRYEVDYCLAQNPAETTEVCRFEYCPWIMFVVCILNLFKALIMTFVWLLRIWQDKERQNSEKQVLYTLGDAIGSFMRQPDPTTKDMGLATKDDFLTRRSLKTRLVKRTPTLERNPREFRKAPKRWMAAASWKRWIILICLCMIVILISAILLADAFPNLHHRNIDTSLSNLWSLGFGKLSPYTYLVIGLPRRDPEGLIANVLIANLPQLILSIIYIFYNSMLSTFLVQREFSLMYKKRKPLRVSEPIGIQRSSYFISLPLRYGIPLYVTSGMMHWLISQSLFLARITALTPEGGYDAVNSFSTCGYSPVAIIITLIVGFILVLAIVALGYFRWYDGTMPMVSTNSRAISAACHALPEDQANGYLLPVQWGVVQIQDGVGKVAFTTAPSHTIKEPKEGRYYI
ncbi:hypothetical protein BX600DRAFT_458587 [Xylariales sp. PMI_506]|nr:hypothetical protein BX600DRAFT_458587 [Xylariales sp. PMI_506]